MKTETYLNNRRQTVEDALTALIPKAAEPFTAHIEAMRYSLFAGGKRIRPILCLAAAEAVDGTAETVLSLQPVLCALECIHTYSLIHDDLPAMDNDTLRRGKPTNHVVYGEAEAILAGDGLLTFAFELLTDSTNSSLDAAKRLEITHIIAHAAGTFGMVGGQALDMENEQQSYPFEQLQTIHAHKTGALITASVLAGAIGAGATQLQKEQLTHYGRHIGLAFQIVDDLLNATGTTDQLGKSAGSDKENGKATYPGYFGIEKTSELAEEAIQSALNAISTFDRKAEPLRLIAEYIQTRNS